jgi:dTDP-4-amino-4,6-dideoxygalactose transaminase
MEPLPRKRDLVEEFWDADTLAACRDHAGPDDLEEFLNELGAFLGASGRMWAARSASDALQRFLAGAVARDKRHVLICSFNCRIVADAVRAAGCRVETFDLGDVSGRIDWCEVAGRLAPRHGALVVPHLFGVPTDFRPVRGPAANTGTLIVEDCAHTLGGTLDHKTAGTLGDAAVFSFNYDKPISLGGGGALLVNHPALWPKIRCEPPVLSIEREAQELALFLVYLRRRRGGTPTRPWAVRTLARSIARASTALGETWRRRGRWSPVGSLFPVTGFGALRAALGRWQLRAYPDIVRRRNDNASRFAERTHRSWHVPPGATPAWLRQKVMPPRFEDSKRLSASLRREGFPVGTVNWAVTIDEYLGDPRRPNATLVARHGLDVPIHQNLQPAEIDIICESFCETVASPPRRSDR